MTPDSGTEAFLNPPPSTGPPPVHAALALVMGDVRAVAKAGRNEEQKYSFRGVDDVMNAVGPMLRKHGVIVLPTNVRDVHRGNIEIGRNRTLMGHVSAIVEFTVIGPAGDRFSGEAPGEAMDSGDKATAKMMSVAYRTFLIQALCLPTGEIDPDAQNYERARKRTPAEERSRLAELAEQETREQANQLRFQIGRACDAHEISRVIMGESWAKRNGDDLNTTVNVDAMMVELDLIRRGEWEPFDPNAEDLPTEGAYGS